MNARTFLRRLTLGRTFRSKGERVSGGWAAFNYWRNWLHIAVDINFNGLVLALGPLWLDVWWAGGDQASLW